LTERHALPDMRGRREKALDLIQFVSFNLPLAEGYCADLSKIIKEFDDLSEGTLKDIAQIKESDAKVAFNKLKDLVPESFIRNVMHRVDRMTLEPEIILLAEEFKSDFI
jgi:hypothetical protein